MSVWDDPDLQVGGEFVKFENVGDSVSGTVNVVRSHKWDDGSSSPQILLTTDDGEERTVTASQIRLKYALVEQRPEAGDHLSIVFSQVEKRPGGKTLKHFDVAVRRGNGAATTAATPTAPAAAPATPPAAPVADPAAAAAALAALSPEQRAALGL